MPNTLEFAALGEGIGDATAVLRNNAASAGLSAPVPTCPGWTMRDLVVHQGLVHRWAAATVRREQPRADEDVEAEAADAIDLLEWLDEGMVELLNALAGAPEQWEAPFFLQDAPPVRQAWARRQCHETTIHGVDAMAARLGRAPRPDQVWFSPGLARDGIDELLLGFAPRRRYAVTYRDAVRLSVATDDGLGAWTVSLGPDGTTATTGADVTAGTRVSGTARGVYAGLWNRGSGYNVEGDPAPLESFLEQLRVTW